MKCLRKIISLVALMMVASFTASKGASESPLPLTDNTAPPYMGIYEAVPNSGKPGTTQVDEYAKWLNRTLVWAHGSEGWDSWGSIDRANWLFSPWSKWVAENPNRRMVFSIALMPWSPKDGPAYTLKEGATGAYNSHFVTLAKMLVNYKLENSILRLGWEFDGAWYPWKTLTPEDAPNLAQLFHQVVTAMHAVPGAEKLTFCWNGMGEGKKYELEAAYPGDDVVDYVGMDIYDKTWAKDTYPCPPDATPSEKLERQKKAWEYLYNSRHGVKEWLAFAKTHHKPFFIPEWGLMNAKNHGGDDDPYFIQQMYDLIRDPANNVYEAAYWDAREAKIIPTGGYVSPYPESTALFQKLFSLPAPTKP